MEPELRLAAGTVLSEAGGRHYATDTRAGAVYEMNEAAWHVLRALAQGEAPAAVDRLAAAFPGVPRTELAADARDLVAQLVRLGLAVPAASSGQAVGRGAPGEAGQADA